MPDSSTASPSSPTESKLRKELGLFDVYSISTGAMFSSGFFLLPGLAAAQTGPSVALAYLVAGVFILPAMFSVAELATAMPKAGGAYYFLDRALGPLVGTIGGLGTWLALVLKSAFALVGMGAYLRIYFDIPIEPLAVGLTLLFMVINVVGAKESSGLQRILVTVLIGVLLFFIVQGLGEITSMGITEVAEERFTPFFAFGFAGFMSTVGFVFVSYAGLTKVASVAEEVRNPDRNIPVGMVLSLITASVVYTVGVFILVAVLPADELRSDLRPVASAAEAFFDWLPGGAGVMLIVVAAIAAFASTGNAGIMSASRYPLAMARDRLVSPRFGKLGRFQTPTFSIVVTALLMIAAIVFLDVASIAKLASAFQLLLFSLLCLAVVIMRESRIEGYDPGFKSPLYPWLQVFGFVTPMWLVAEMGEMAIVFSVGLLGLTIAWYLHYARPRVQRSGAILHTFARLGENRYSGLDHELRSIVAEKGLRAEDPLDRIVAGASVLEFRRRVTLARLTSRASEILSEDVPVTAENLVQGFRQEVEAGFLPVAHGVALPHLRLPGLTEPRMLLARCHQGVDRSDEETSQVFGELELVRAVFFLLSPAEEPGQHLRLLGHLATHVDEEGFLEAWMSAESDDELRATLLVSDGLVTLHVGTGPGCVPWNDTPLRELRHPKGTLVALVRRGSERIIPDGATVLRDGDRLTVLGEPDALAELWRDTGSAPDAHRS